MNNPMCDGSGPCSSGEVRVLPYTVDGNIILCRSCFEREIAWRIERNRDLSADCKFKLPPWESLRVYGEHLLCHCTNCGGTHIQGTICPNACDK